MNLKTVLQWLVVGAVFACVLVMVKALSKGGGGLPVDRENQPLYREVLEARQASEQLQGTEFEPKSFARPLKPPTVMVRDGENTNEVSYEEIR